MRAQVGSLGQGSPDDRSALVNREQRPDTKTRTFFAMAALQAAPLLVRAACPAGQTPARAVRGTVVCVVSQRQLAQLRGSGRLQALSMLSAGACYRSGIVAVDARSQTASTPIMLIELSQRSPAESPSGLAAMRCACITHALTLQNRAVLMLRQGETGGGDAQWQPRPSPASNCRAAAPLPSSPMPTGAGGDAPARQLSYPVCALCVS